MAANDLFGEYYAEKIWALIPAIYRHEDGVASRPGQLRALVEILADQAAVARRDVDRLLADSRIDEADDWAIPYIGALLGTRLVSPLNPAGRRADVKHTISNRRRAGTPDLLERLADDIADWDAVASEGFRRLARTWHMLDTEVPIGPVTRTPQGGYANLRSVRVMDVLDGPFDDLAHYPDCRPGRGHRGLYNIPNVNLFLFRQYAFPLAGVTPYRLDSTHFTLDPSGRDVPLFQIGGEVVEECTDRNEWDVRAPITCRRLNAGLYRIEDDPTNPAAWDPLVGRTFFTQHSLLDAATGLGAIAEDLVAAALIHPSPKWHLLADPPPPPPAPVSANARPSLHLAIGTLAAPMTVLRHEIAGAGLAFWGAFPTTDAWIKLLVDPARGRVQMAAAPAGGRRFQALKHHYGIFYPVGAGTHDRRDNVPQPTVPPAPVASLSPVWTNIAAPGDVLIGDSRTYTPVTAAAKIRLRSDARIWARDGVRPYVTLKPSAGQRTIKISHDPGIGRIELNGLWLGLLLHGAVPAPTDVAELVFQGDWEQIWLRDLSLDPGGERAAAPLGAPTTIPHVRLIIEGTVDELLIERSMIGSIAERGLGGAAPCTAAKIRIADSIVQGHPSGPALNVGTAEVRLDRVTMIGDCHCGRAEISESIIDGQVLVEDAQGSCFRFSTARSGGRIPAQFESVILPDGLPPGSFVSRRFGDPGYLQLSETCPREIATGAENGTEMGVFNRALDPIKRADLKAKVQEYAPVQARVQLLFAT